MKTGCCFLLIYALTVSAYSAPMGSLGRNSEVVVPEDMKASNIEYYTRPIYDTSSIPAPGEDPIQIGTETNWLGEAMDELFFKVALGLPRTGGNVGSLRVDGSLRVGDYEFIGSGDFYGVNIVQDGSDLGIGVDGETLIKLSSGKLAFTILDVSVDGTTATITIDASTLLVAPTVELTTNLVDGTWVDSDAAVTGPVDGVYTAVIDVSGFSQTFFRAIGETARGNTIQANAPIMSIKQPGEDSSFIRLYSYATNMTSEEAIADESLRIFRLWNDHGTPKIDMRPQGSSNLTVRIDSEKITTPVMVMIPQSSVPGKIVGGFYVSESGNLYICRDLTTGWELQ